MSRWKLFNRLRLKKESTEENIPSTKNGEKIEREQNYATVEIRQKPEEEKSIEYNETLQSTKDTYRSKEEEIPVRTSKGAWIRSTWEDIATIEKNIDNMDISRREEKYNIYSSESIDDVEKKVDKLLSKRK